MKKTYYLFLLLIALTSLVPQKAKASHVTGAELTYEWVHDSTYRIYYKFYRDCAGTAVSATIPLCIKNSCTSYTATNNMTLVTGLLPTGEPNGYELAPQCPSAPSTCTSTSSTIPGWQAWWYTTTVTLPSRCNSWEFSVFTGTRNVAITNLSSAGDLWIDATLDNLHFQGDSSPTFTTKPVPYILNNVAFDYNMGAVDANNDSMTYELAYPSGSSTCADTYGMNLYTFATASPAYNLVNNPIACNNTFSINARTGAMHFTPNVSQLAVMSVLVKSYRNGMLVGHVTRDIEWIVKSSTHLPTTTTVNVTNVTGGTVATNGDIKICAGNHADIEFLASTTAIGPFLAIRDNHTTATPGAGISYPYYSIDSIYGHFSWTPSLADSGLKILTVTVWDSTCTYAGIGIPQTYTIPVYVNVATVAYHDTTIIAGGSAHLRVTGGSSFTWSVLPGGSPLSSLSCTTCSNPVATPTVTTHYVVTSNLITGCNNTDTVTVTVLPTTSNIISGAVTINSVSPNPASPICKVWLIVHTTSPDSLYAIDSTIDTGSTYIDNYQFVNEPAGTYLIKAALLNGPTSGTGPVPTYDSSSIYWDSANTVVYSGSGQSTNNNIYMRQGAMTSGPGFIAGTIASGANKGTGGSAVPNMMVYLLDNNGHLIAHATTTATGSYSFSNLALGTYTVYPEQGAYKTTAYKNIILNSVGITKSGVDFTEHTISKTITPNSVGIANIEKGSFRIAPNPTTGIVNIYWQQVAGEAATVTVTDILGRKVVENNLNLNHTSGTAQLNLTGSLPGIYFITINAGVNNYYVSKIVLQ